MPLLFTLDFSADCDELAKAGHGDTVMCRPFVMSVGGTFLRWEVAMYPAGLLTDSGRSVDKFGVGLGLTHLPEGLAGVFYPKFKVELLGAHGWVEQEFPEEPGAFTAFAFVDGHRAHILNMPTPTLAPGTRLQGRVLVLIDPEQLRLDVVLRYRIRRLGCHGPKSLQGKLVQAGLDGDERLCDTVVICADGRVRAASNALRLESDYFAKLFEAVGEADGLLMFKDNSVAVVSAVLRLALTTTLPSLDDIDQSQLVELLELGAQVDPAGKGQDVVKLAVQERIYRELSGEPTSALMSFARLHELSARVLEEPPEKREEYRELLHPNFWKLADGETLHPRLTGVEHKE